MVCCITYMLDIIQVRFYVVEKSTGKVLTTKFVSPPCSIFHHINAYEDNGKH